MLSELDRQPTQTKRLLITLSLGVLVSLGVVLIVIVQPFRSPDKGPVALRTLSVYPNALDVNTPSEASALLDERGGKGSPPDPLNKLTFTTQDSPDRVLDFYKNNLRSEGWKLLEHRDGPKLWDYINGNTNYWRRFAWLDTLNRSLRPTYFLDVMAFPSQRSETAGMTVVSITVDEGPDY